MLYGHLFLPACPAAPTTGEKLLTIMSFNIWGGSRSKETARVLPDNASPDVVAIQELTPHMAQVLVEEVGDVYPHRVFSTGTQNRGMGVLSRHPLAELDSSRLSDPDWQIQVVQVEANGRTFKCKAIYQRGVQTAVTA
jgi:exonuclease III